MDKRIAILGTSQVLNYETEKLEQRFLDLLNEGYRVIVISSRERPTKMDGEWLSKLPIEDVHFVGGRAACAWDSTAPEYVVNWRKVFEELSLTPPIDPRSWIQWRSAASEQGIHVG